jgi:hypothetical protein
MKLYIIFVLTNILIILSGCDKNEENSFPKGSIVGFVHLIDENGNVSNDRSGVNVSIEGIAKSAITNEIGRVELTNVPAGTYNILFSKEGYGTCKISSFQFIGGNFPALLNQTILYKQPQIVIQNIEISLMETFIDMLVEIPPTRKYKFQAFVKNSPDVSNLDYDFSFTSSRSGAPVTQFNHFVMMNDTTYLPGEKLYLATYFVNTEEELNSFDYEKEKYYYTSARKATDVLSLIYK